MGEKILEFTSEKKKLSKINGALFEPVDLAIKDIVRNDLERLIHFQLFMCLKKGRTKFLGSADFSIA